MKERLKANGRKEEEEINTWTPTPRSAFCFYWAERKSQKSN